MPLYCGRCITALGVEELNTLDMPAEDAPLLTAHGRPHREAVTVIDGVALCRFCVGIDQAKRNLPSHPVDLLDSIPPE